MKYPRHSHVPRFDAASITETIERALASAGLDTKAGPMQDVTDTIRKALSAGGMAAPSWASSTDPHCVDVEARLVVEPQDKVVDFVPRPGIAKREEPGTFVTREFTNHAGTRAYKLYVPAHASAPMPVVVMLHGCTQSANDFATGTKMNRLADEHGFLVVYPEQPAHANPSKCWNWFKSQDQLRDCGEPSLIAGIVREVVANHDADPQRIFVAGLSAGAAMAIVLGETYPELFAGVGAHSGLAYGSAHDIPSAMLAMKGGRSGIRHPRGLPGTPPVPRRKAAQAVPIIVFHGDRDHTVQHANGEEIIRQAADAHAADAGEGLRTRVERGSVPGGRAYSRTIHADASGQSRMESWTVHGAGHAWSGGDARGSHTDPNGPDASAAMVRFFLDLPCAGAVSCGEPAEECSS
ncbi:extracellular catalytic domain type 1 short-chain-length polyhydroxyalkanoate depolymerase [Piscinibacter terrae]|uniref:Esterase n=1 Tax=Piscinibacter terrae TaxID=2496871 RepID=A0A3N7HVY5_9BURK|nr:PHB depolymerase family esterase [Albitalea terrae]RQP26013.1 esterase [Albitalea terrae]